MSDIAQSIDAVIKMGLSDLLKTHGFKKSGRNWHKADGANWQIVNVQASTANIGEEGKFTINLGVYCASVAALADQRELVGEPKEYDSTLRRRLGTLAYGRDHWWAIAPNTNLGATSNDVVEKMLSLGLPWLDAHQEIKRLSDALKENPSLLSVSAAWLAGHRDQAEQRLRAAIALRPTAAGHFSAWAAKNGFTL